MNRLNGNGARRRPTDPPNARRGRSRRRLRGRRVEILCDRDELCVTWTRFGPGRDGASPHIHRTHSDLFYVLARRADVPRRAGARRSASSRPARSRSRRRSSSTASGTRGDEELRYLNFHAPGGGFADYLRGVHARASTRRIRPRTAAGRSTDGVIVPAGPAAPRRPGRDPDRGAGRAGAGVEPAHVPLRARGRPLPRDPGVDSARGRAGALRRARRRPLRPATTTSSRRR